jgi:hypothetical protein
MTFRKKVHNQHPFGILEIGRVGLGEFGHSPILPDYLRNTLLGLPVGSKVVLTNFHSPGKDDLIGRLWRTSMCIKLRLYMKGSLATGKYWDEPSAG